MGLGAIANALDWAKRRQLVAEVSAHHERAAWELWTMLAGRGIRNALEVGCGEAPYLALRMLRGEGIEATGMDILSTADVQGDSHDIPFGPALFDLVVARHVLEHVLCPYVVLMEMARVSRDYLLVVTPTDSAKSLEWPDHLWFLTAEGWELIFRNLGLHIVWHEEGDHTEDHARRSGEWTDHEWRWLLRKGC